MIARAAIFARIRRSLAVDGDDDARRASVEARLAERPKGIIPARGQLASRECVALFRTMAEQVSASVEEVAGAYAVPAAVAAYLRAHNLPAAWRMGADARLAALPWQTLPQAEIRRGPAEASDAVCLSHAIAGVAETGTLVLVSGTDNPTTLNFLPEAHIVVIRAEDIAGDYETVWERLRAAYGAGKLPRTVNFITGPSRSADIGQQLLLGAHGPRRLHIVILG